MKKLPIIALLLMLVLMTAVDVYITGEGALHANTRTPGSTVENPMPVTLPLVDFAGDTSLYGDDYEASWVTPTGNYLGGDDMVLQFILTEQSEISGTLQAVTGNWIGMYVVNTAPNPTTPAPVLASATNTGTLATMSPTTLPAGTYYLLISTWPSPQSFQFNLNLSAVSMINPPAPANIVSPSNNATNVAANASLNWTAGSGAPTGYYLYFGTNNPPTNIVNGSDLGNVLTYNPGLLTYSTPYYWQVVPYNPYGNASDCPVWSFTTMDDPTIAVGPDSPWMEDFGTVTGDWPVLNWSQLSGLYPTPTGTSTQWYRDDWVNGPSGNNAAMINIFGTSKNGWLVTPPIAIPTTGYELKFDLGLTDYASTSPIEFPTGQADDKFIVLIADNPEMTGATPLRLWDNDTSEYVYNEIPNTGTTVILDLDSYVGTYYFAFYGESTVSVTGEDNDLFVDNVTVRETPSLPIISVSPDSWDFGTQLINTTTSQSFTIANDGGAPLVLNSVNVTGTGFALSEAFSSITLQPTESTTITVNFNPLTETTYSGNIAINDNRAVTNIPLIGAAIDATIYSGDLPHIENFDSVTIPDLPVGWTSIDNNADNDYWKTATGYANSGDKSASIYTDYNTANDDYLVTPPIELTGSQRLSFWTRARSTSEPEELSVVLSTTTPTSGAFTNVLMTSTPINFTTYTQYNIDLDDYNGICYIAFKRAADPANGYYLYIDDVKIDVILPEPPEPATLVWPLNSITTLPNPLLEWAPSATGEPATGYKVYMNDSGTFTETDLIYEGTATQFQTADMGYERTYYWKVLPINAHGSDPTCPTWSFSTPLENQLAEGFENTVPPVGWSSVGTAWSRSSTYKVEGTYSAYKAGSTSSQYILSTPLLTIIEGSTLQFGALGTTTSASLEIVYSEDRTTWTQIGSTITFPVATTFYPQVIDLSDLAGNNYYLGFRTGLTSGSTYIDHVVGPELTPVLPGAPTLSAPADAAENQSNYPSFTWTAPTTGGVPSGYNIYMDTVDGSTLYASNVTSPYVPTTALDWEETYYWTVKAFNNAGTGEAPTARSFTVRSDPTIYVNSTTPWLVDFGTVTGDWPVLNWSQLSGLYPTPTGTSTQWYRDNWLNGPSGNNAAKINIYGGYRYGWLVTPPISIPADGYELKFDLGLTDCDYSNPIEDLDAQADDKFMVLVSDYPTMAGATPLRTWDNDSSEYVYNAIPYTGTSITIPLSSISGTKYFAFYGESTVSGNGDNDLFVDNVLIRETVVAAPDPVTLISPADEAENMPVDGFNLTWSPAVTGGTPTGYYVIMGSTADPDYMEYSWELGDVTNFDPTQAAENPVTFAYSETWYWTVMATNGDGDATVPTSFSFTIMDDPRILSLPYSQNFDGVSAPALPAAFVKLGTGTVQTQTTNNYSAPNCLYMYSSVTTTISMLVLPDVVLNNVHAKLSFMGRANFTAGGIVQVGYLTDPTDPATFVVIDQVTMASLTYASYEVDLGTINGTMHYALRANPVSPFNSLLIDNLELTEVVPIDMSVVSLTGMPYGFQNTALTHTVTVKNNGSVDVSNYTVYLKSVETRAILGQESFTDPLAANATNAVEFTWTPTSLGAMDIYGEVYVADDAVAANNTSELMSFNVYQEGILFESFEGGVIPANWTVLNADGGTQVWQATTVNPRTGTYAARVRYETSSLDNDDWLITPPLQVTSSTTDNISFWMRTYNGTSADPWQVLISTTDTNPASFTMIDEGDGMLANYVQKSYNLDSYGDAIIYLAVRYMGAFDWYLYVDEFVGPPVYEPASLDTPEVTISTVGSNVVLNWDAIPYANSYDVMVADAPEGPYTLATTVTAPTYSSAAASKKFYKVIAKAGATRSIVSPVLSLEQQLLQDEMDRAARSRQ